DDRPAGGPCAPEARTDVLDEEPDLDRERARERLAHGDPLAHLVLGEPLALLDELPLHLTAERDGAAEPERAQAEIVGDELADRHPLRSLALHHVTPPRAGSGFRG